MTPATLTLDGADVLTHSRMSAFRACPKKHQFRYEIGLRHAVSSEALRLGGAYHLGLEKYDTSGRSPVAGVEAIRANYAARPESIPDEDWALEREKAMRLFCGHAWRWDEDDRQIEVIATEQSFEIPMVNPETNRTSRTWRLAGKIDRIIRLSDGRLAVQEYKTTGMSIESDADYWRRLRLDQQISLYMLAARLIGYDVQTVLYDVCRKPSIRPRKITKKENAEIEDGGKWFGEPIGDADLAYAAAEGRETPAMFGARLTADIGERPDFYYARHEIPRLDSDLNDFRGELWGLAKTINDCRQRGSWPRNTSSCLMMGQCEYFGICAEGIDPAMGLPAGFELVGDVHPELETRDDVSPAESN